MSQQKLLTLESPVKWVKLKKYDLANIKQDFEIADFEREINQGHVKSLAESIIQHKILYNNIISVTNEKSPWTVFDGQHRLTALWLCYTEKKVRFCDLMLAVYPKEFGRVIYRRINMGLPLQLKSHLKAMDDGKNEFFKSLEPHLSHHPRPDKPEYATVIQAIGYAKGFRNSVSIKTIDELMEQIGKKEIDTAIKVCKSVRGYSPTVFGERVYQATYLRNIFKIAYKHDLSEKQIEKLIDKMLKDTKIPEMAIRRRMRDIIQVYEYLHNGIILDILKK